MTWDRLKALGSGRLRWRVKIARCPIEFVSHQSMVRDSDGFDYDSLSTEAPSLLPDASSISWGSGATPPVYTTGQTDPTGGTDAILMEDVDVTGSAHGRPTVYAPVTAGQTYWHIIQLKKDSSAENFCVIRTEFESDPSANIDLAFHLGTGQYEWVTPRTADVWVFPNQSNPDWWFIAIRDDASASATGARPRIFPAYGDASDFGTNRLASVGGITLYDARVIDINSFIIAERRNGINSEGFAFRENVDLATAEWRADSLSVKVVDIGNHATRLFHTTPSISTYLTADCLYNGSFVSVLNTGEFPDSGTLWVNTEAIHYTEKTSSLLFGGLTRHVLGSGEQTHYVETEGLNARSIEVTNWPVSFEGSRVYFYAYGDGDDPTLDGHLMWRGVMSTEPQYDGLTWSFSVDSLARILDQEIAGDLGEPLPIRGIYYPASAPLCMRIMEWPNDQTIDPGGLTHDLSFAVAGFWETQGEFLQYINTIIAGEAFTQDIRAVAYGDSWCLQYVTDSAPKMMDALIESATDHRIGLYDSEGNDANEEGYAVLASSLYRILISGGTVPRATIGDHAPAGFSVPGLPSYGVDLATFPPYRIYLGGAASLPTDPDEIALSLKWTPNGPYADSFGDLDQVVIVTGVDTTSRYVEFRPTDPCAGMGPDTVEAKLGRRYEGLNLVTFLLNLASATRDLLNLGASVDIRNEDINTSGILFLPTTPLTLYRSYVAFKPIKLSELLEGECQLLGAYPRLESDGRLGFAKLQIPMVGGGQTLTVRELIVDDEFYRLEKSAVGLYNTVVIHTGYDALEDEHKGTTYTFRNLRALGRTPTARTLEIEPKSGELDAPTAAEVGEVQKGLTALYGVPYQHLTVSVPFTMFDVLVGDVLSLTWRKVPNFRGSLGVTDGLGLVISREWEPRAARGRLTLYLTDTKIGGYVPSGKLDSWTNVVGNQWEIVPSSTYLPSDETWEDHLQVGHLIRLFPWNSTSSTSVDATVDVVTGNTISITVLSTWTPTGLWAFGSRLSSAIGDVDQQRYVYIGQSTGAVLWSGGETAAPFLLAP